MLFGRVVLKMEALCSPKTLVATYKLIRGHNLKYHSLHRCSCLTGQSSKAPHKPGTKRHCTELQAHNLDITCGQCRPQAVANYILRGQ
jgi:hypothetical protein